MKTGHLINTIRFLKRRAIRDYGEVWEDCVIPVYYTMLHEAEYRNVKYDRPQPINIITMVQDGDDTPREVSRVRISTGGKY